MAEIKPIRSWRYNTELSKSIDELVSPLFDVVSEKQCKALYKNTYNSIHLSVPQLPNPTERASTLLAAWKKNGVLIQDARISRGLSEQQCADAVGIPLTTFHTWQLGQGSPSLPQLEMLAYFIGVPVSHFWDTKTVASAQPPVPRR